MLFAITERPQVGDLVQITFPDQTILQTRIESIQGKQLVMKNTKGNLTWENSQWLLPNGLIPNDIEFYISQQNRFPFYNLDDESKLQILINAPKEEFNVLCDMPELDFICNGVTSNRLYKERLEKETDEELFKLIQRLKKDRSWKEVYNEFQVYLIDHKDLYQDYIKDWLDNEFYFALDLHKTFNPNIDLNYLIKFAIQAEDILGLKWLFANGYNNFDHGYISFDRRYQRELDAIGTNNIELLNILRENGLFSDINPTVMDNIEFLQDMAPDAIEWLRENNLI